MNLGKFVAVGYGASLSEQLNQLVKYFQITLIVGVFDDIKGIVLICT